MPVVRLTIIVASPDRARFRAALSIAAAEAALGRAARLFVQEEAVALLTSGLADADDERLVAAGLPTMGQLLDEVLAAGISCSVCQSGLTLVGASASALPAGVEVGGLVGLLADAAADRLLLA